MSSITSYKTTAFKESQKLFVIDPSTQSPSLVLGSDLVSYITPMLNYVRADSTRLSAENTDYDIGTLVQTSGATSPGDNLASIYLVVEGGTGDFPMLNGNDLLVIAGDDDLRAQLISNAAGEGSDLVAHTGTANTVTQTLDQNTTDIAKRTISGELEIDVSGGADVTVTDAQSKYSIIELTGTITANINVVVPNTPRLYTFVNSTSGSFTITVKTSAGTGVVVPQGDLINLRCDGANVIEGLPYKLNANDALGGAAQSWQDVTASRSSGVTYTNSTGRPIRADFIFQSTGTGGFSGEISLGSGVLIDNGQYSDAAGKSFVLSAIIPPGETYTPTATFSSILVKSLELR